MNQEILLELGRVVYINHGPLSGKIAVVAELLNKNRTIIDGPGLGIPRQVISNRRLELTKFKLSKFTRETKQGELKKMIEEFDLVKRFNQTGRGQKIQKQKRRAELTDFDRFKVMVLKRKLARATRQQINAHKKTIKK